MVRFSLNLWNLSVFFIASSVGSSGVLASPATRATKCSKLSHGPFKLYAVTDDGIDYPVKLLAKYTPRPTNDTYTVLSNCPAEDCGQLPSQWTLDEGVLKPAYANVWIYPTINLPVNEDSNLLFLTSDEDSLEGRGSPDYCVTRNAKTVNGLPAILAGPGGDAENFSLCTSSSSDSTSVSTSHQNVWYKVDPRSNGAGMKCQKVHLVMQSTQFVAEPVPE